MEDIQALDIVKNHFLICGGVLSNVEFTFKDTKKWKEAKLHSIKTVEFTLEILDGNNSHWKQQNEDFWNKVLLEIKKL